MNIGIFVFMKRKKQHIVSDEEEEEGVDMSQILKRSLINEAIVQAFVNEFQPETDERLPYVKAFSMGELREYMHIYRTFDDKMPDPLPYYLERLEEDGFSVRIGFANEPVLLISRRDNGKSLSVS